MRVIHNQKSKYIIGMRELHLPRPLHGPDCFSVSFTEATVLLSQPFAHILIYAAESISVCNDALV